MTLAFRHRLRPAAPIALQGPASGRKLTPHRETRRGQVSNALTCQGPRAVADMDLNQRPCAECRRILCGALSAQPVIFAGLFCHAQPLAFATNDRLSVLRSAVRFVVQKRIEAGLRDIRVSDQIRLCGEKGPRVPAF